jgi:hypothetical protein
MTSLQALIAIAVLYLVIGVFIQHHYRRYIRARYGDQRRQSFASHLGGIFAWGWTKKRAL